MFWLMYQKAVRRCAAFFWWRRRRVICRCQTSRGFTSQRRRI